MTDSIEVSRVESTCRIRGFFVSRVLFCQPLYYSARDSMSQSSKNFERTPLVEESEPPSSTTWTVLR